MCFSRYLILTSASHRGTWSVSGLVAINIIIGICMNEIFLQFRYLKYFCFIYSYIKFSFLRYFIPLNIFYLTLYCIYFFISLTFNIFQEADGRAAVY